MALHQPDSAERSAAPSSRPGLPFGLVLGTLAGLAVLISAARPIVDVDSYWHLLAGAELAGGTSPSEVGLGWSFAPDPYPWVSTQWLAELLFHHLFEWFSWAGLIGFRVLTAAATIGVLAWTTLRGRPAALAGLPFVLGTGAVLAASQERPQQFTFIGAALVGAMLSEALRTGAVPGWWLAFLGTALWANLHGGWVLVPMAFGILGLAWALDPAGRRAGPVRPLGLGLLTLAAGMVSPAGTANVTAVARFSSAAELIDEWRPTAPIEDVGIFATAILFLVAVGWARSPIVPRSELIVVLALFAFSLAAIRYVVPAVLLLAPIVADRLAAAFPTVGVQPEPRWSKPIGIGVALALTLGALATLPGRQHLPLGTEPIALARGVAELPTGQRVLNDYNTAGIILWFGGPGTQVAIDGRTDRYGADYIDNYLNLQEANGDWPTLLDELAPTAALLREDSALVYVLDHERGWRTVRKDSGYVLLVPPRGDR